MPVTVQENVELAPLTTFGVKARARYFCEVGSADELKGILADRRFEGVPRFILGGGSNVLFTQDYEGLVIRMVSRGVRMTDENDEYAFLEADAGVVWSEFVSRTIEKGLSGLENLSLVPGTVGGAAVQNIGAYGVEVAERIQSVTCWDPEGGCEVTLSCDECDFGYRSSIFKTQKKNLIVLRVVFSLSKSFVPVVGYKELAAQFGENPPQSAREVADAVIGIRRKKLPDPQVIGSAGSFFKNPVVSREKMRHLLEDNPRLVCYPLAGARAKLAAGWLIDSIGMKGRRVGDAAVYERQALVLVNYGNATGAQIKALADEIIVAVKRRYGVLLEPEPVIL